MPKMFEVTLKGEYQSQETINRLTFVSDNDLPNSSTAVGLVNALGLTPGDTSTPAPSSVLQAYLAVQTEIFRLNEILVRNIHNVTDFYTAALSGAGWVGGSASGGNPSLSFVANKLQTNRVRTDIRRGSLSLTPYAEGNYDGEGDMTAPALAALVALTVELNTPPTYIIGGETTLFQPSVLKKEKYDVPNTDPVRKAYRYYTDPAVQLANAAVNVTWFVIPRATSQVSRKIGKGS